jgi:hypothetical protein
MAYLDQKKKTSIFKNQDFLRMQPPRSSSKHSIIADEQVGIAITGVLQKRVEELQSEIHYLTEKRDQIDKLFIANDPSGFVKVKVGGKIFCLSQATLGKEASFLSALTHRASKLDDDGTILIDGDGDVFPYIAAYLRHGVVVVPSDPGLRQILLLEARYYAIDGLVSELMGSPKTSFSIEKFLPREFLDMKVEEDTLRTLFVKNRDCEELSNPYLNLVRVFQERVVGAYDQALPELFESPKPKPGSSVIVPSLTVFREHLSWFTNAFEPVDNEPFDWSNVICAGGAVLACTLPLPASIEGDGVEAKKYYRTSKNWGGSDVDIFLYNLGPDEAMAKLMQIMLRFEKRNALFVRTEHCVTAIFEGKQVQIILRLYKSPAEVLMGFDLDCCTIMFNGEDVFALPRCMRALRYRMNMVDQTRQSKSYIHRLIKYAKRGFAIGVPGLDRSQINPQIYATPIGDLGGLARLLVLETMFIQGYQNAVGGCVCEFVPDDFVRSSKHSCKQHYSSSTGFQIAVRCLNSDALFEDEFSSDNQVHDYTSVFIPSGPLWTRGRLLQLLNGRSIAISKARKLKRRESKPEKKWLHADTVEGLLIDHRLCEGPGPLTWISENPGSQLSGSFRPIDNDFFQSVFLPMARK